MLNKYKDLYDKIVQDMVNLHNAHMHFHTKINQTSALEVRMAIKSLNDHADELRKAVMQVQKEHRAFLKTQRLEYKARLREQRENKARKREHLFKKKETK
jgi:hypothetical protein